jgi:predicted nucleic acid-binding protein
MIVVDSSVWIGHFRDHDTAAVRKLRSIEALEQIIVGDVILLEVLQGARDERHASRLEGILREFKIEFMLDDEVATKAARNYRMLRRKGITIRTTVDLVIATFCAQREYALLHDDRDFQPLISHLDIRAI